MNYCIFTVCSRNYLAQALSLGDSMAKVHPEIEFRIYLADSLPESVGPLRHKVVEASTCGFRDYEKMAFQYNVIEFSTALKPFVFVKLLEEEGFDRVVYLDPDIWVYKPLQPVFAALDSASIVVTPHFCSFDEQTYRGGVPLTEILWVGGFNLGFCGISKTEWGRRIARWWAGRLANMCYADKEDGLHVDQKWIDLLPCILPPGQMGILRHLGCNVAFWNMHEKIPVESDAGIVMKGVGIGIEGVEDDLVFFHFSGFNPNNPSVVHSRHTKYNIEDFPAYKGMFAAYAETVLRNGYNAFSRLDYGNNFFTNDVFVFDFYRRLVRSREEKAGLVFSSYFGVGPNSVFAFLKANRLLISDRSGRDSSISGMKLQKTGGVKRKIKLLESGLRLAHRILGARNYYFLAKSMGRFGRLENNLFLVDAHRDSNDNLWT